MNEIAVIVATALSGSGLGGFFGWLFGRRQQKANANSTEIGNFNAAIEAYKHMYEDMINDLKVNQAELKKENQDLKEELSENRKQIMTLTNFVLASAIKRADGTLVQEDIDNYIKSKGYKIDSINLGMCRPYKDFGTGFYFIGNCVAFPMK